MDCTASPHTHTPVARAAFENSCIEFIFAQCCVSECLNITPLSQDKVCFYLDLAFCVIQTVEPVRECVCSVSIQT